MTHRTNAGYKIEREKVRLRLERERARMARVGMSPYSEMTRRVEQETGTDSKTWSMLDQRWERVVYLTRALIGIPQDVRMTLRETRPRQTHCKYGHDLTDPSNVYRFARPDGYMDRKCRTCQRERLAKHRCKVAA